MQMPQVLMTMAVPMAGFWDLGRGRVVRFGSLCTNALHLCCHCGKQMLQRCLNLRVWWADVFQRDQTLALSAHHFDLYPMKFALAAIM